MASKVIGLDLGGSAIKAAVLKGTYRGYEAVEFVTRPLPLEELAAAVEADATASVSASMEVPPEADEDGDEDGPTTLDDEVEVGPSLRELQLRVTEELLESLDISDATVVVGVPASQASSWVVDVPFTSAKQIQSILPGVLEERVPFDMDEVVLHYHALAEGEDALDG